MSKKKSIYIDDATYNTLMSLMKQNGMPDEVFKIAKKMNVNLAREFYEKLVKSSNIEVKEALLKNLLGIYGNYKAALELKELGYMPENEKKVLVGNHSKTADLCINDENGNNIYFEVKATRQILDYEKVYVDNDESSLNSNFSNNLIAYQNIGKKLIKQVKALRTTQNMVIVLIFSGCYVDDAILQKLKNEGVHIMRLKEDIGDLEKEVYDLVRNVEEAIINKTVFKPHLKK